MTEERTQLDKCGNLASEVEADENGGRWDERLKQVVQHKPVEQPE